MSRADNDFRSSATDLLRIWDEYREGIYTGDSERLGRIFHPSASMYYVVDSEIAVTPIQAYIDIVRNREAPQKTNSPRDEKVLSISNPAADCAVITAAILINGKSYTDQLTLVRNSDGWKIISKTYHLHAETSKA